LLPVTIGLFGDWGGGKSSIMKMIEHDLDPDHCDDEEARKIFENVACLHFNGWLFEGYDDAKAAIISTILKELMAHRRFGERVHDRAKALLQSVDWMRAAKIGLTKVVLPAAVAALTGGASALPAMGAAAASLFKTEKADKDEAKGKDGDESQHKDGDEGDDSAFKGLIKKTAAATDPQDVRTFRQRFSELLEAGDIRTLVVLIDDLDRCSPERIVENLEAIKLFLNVERTAFVVGADPRIVRHAIATHYTRNTNPTLSTNDIEEQSQLVRDYLEKVIQIPYHLPRLSPSETETYMSLLFCMREIGDQDQIDRVLGACERQRESNRYSTFGLAAIQEALGESEIPEGLTESLSFTVGASPLITEGLKGNPRQIKRFLNAFLLRKKLAEVAKLHHVNDAVVVKLMILEYAHEKEFKELYDWQAQNDGHPPQLKAWEKASGAGEGTSGGSLPGSGPPDNWSVPAVQKWLAMPPALAEVDLRDYFWLARDKMSSTLSGMSLVPPYLRLLLDSLLSEVSGKRQDAAKEAVGLQPADRVALLDLLERHMLSNAEDANSYDALHELIDCGVLGATDKLAAVLKQADSAKIPPGEAYRTIALLKEKPDLAATFAPLLTTHKASGTPFGTALGMAGSSAQREGSRDGNV
jgi:predicted KAP-like P-loop ATPase